MKLNFYSFRVAVITSDDEILCNGNLISDQFVISSSYCAVDAVESYKIFLGIYDLDDLNNFQFFEVSKIIFHSTSDIALFKLKSQPIFNEFIQPICLHGYEFQPQYTGIVAGYQKIESGFGNIPIAINMSLFYNEKCSKLSSPLKFCALTHFMAQCAGDIGTGFFVIHNGIFYLQGRMCVNYF